MVTNRIRPIAICVVRSGDRILVEHGFDSAKEEHFFRLPGGAIEFGERAVEAVQREFREELNARLGNPRLIGVVENLFRYEGEPGHEIVFVFEAGFEDARLYQQEEFIIEEPGLRNRASWKSLQELRSSAQPLYPEGLWELLLDGAG